jgi:peptidoglycan/xylan/chitin deacetylase (PgdA/CDA1 family)
MSSDTLKRGWKDLLAGVLYYSGAVSALRIIGTALRQRTTPVFVVHRVAERDDDFYPALSVGALEALVRVLATRYKLIPFDEMARRLSSGTAEPQHACLTFDDGYRRTRELAEPILRRYGAVATTFVCTAGIDGELLFFDRIAQALESTTEPYVSTPDGGNVIALRSREDRLRMLEVYREALRRKSNEVRRLAVQELFSELRVEPGERPEAARLMSRRDLEEVARASDVWHVGSHTIDHVSLDLEREPSAHRQLVESRRVLEEIVQRDVTSFCYPHGDYAPGTLALIRATGYRAAATAQLGGNLPGVDPFKIQRTTAYWPTEARTAVGVEREFYRAPSAVDPAAPGWYPHRAPLRSSFAR